jgi:hypothetical protein
MNFKKILIALLAMVLLLGIVFVLVQVMGQPDSASYTGAKDVTATQSQTSNTETIVGADGQSKNIVVANDPAFSPRSFTAGGDGWLLSVTESQPKVFTGKLLANNGIDTYDIFLQEADNFYTGDAKSRKDGAKSEFSIQKQAGQCKDKEGTTFEYGVVALFQNQTLNGCGGSVVSTTTQ